MKQFVLGLLVCLAVIFTPSQSFGFDFPDDATTEQMLIDNVGLEYVATVADVDTFTSIALKKSKVSFIHFTYSVNTEPIYTVNDVGKYRNKDENIYKYIFNLSNYSPNKIPLKGFVYRYNYFMF